MSQPAISKTLKELEALLGTSLFERSKTGVSLTAAGSASLRYAGPSVQALREGVRSLRAGEHEAGMVRWACCPRWARYCLMWCVGCMPSMRRWW